ncbi:translation initiation factor IF-3 [Agrococcus sp. SCSIO52902]|uniref:translation initiation factor IF-3 n=1 Tax=Agrococcus sp. SCSIO52902 TaxID=2933290 RepID=UPI001FF32183|nr:translation initiation factor IF-3 [Agrococcus sp. SCSIO52902]UOW00135.1 translation initiation factor IF-3 [Agrococcus sp. SCSIO52902]
MKEPAISDPRTNERIRVPEVRLVGPAGEQVGVVRVEDALRLAREADLDLVEVAPNSRPPVVKIMDYGKFKYEQAQKAKEARRNQANTVLKEVRFRLKIDDHDYETKRKRAQGFLEAGDKVKAMILFRGREQSRPEMGVKLLQRFAEDIQEYGAVESSPTIDGRNMVMIVGPMRSKSDAKAELNATRTAQRKADQEKRRAEAERQAARQAEVEASRPARPTLPAGSSTNGDTELTRSPRPATSRPSTTSRPAGSSRPSSDSRDSDARPPRSSERSSEPRSDSRSSEPRSDSRPRQAPRTVQPTPAQAPRPASAPKPAAASAAAAPAAPAAAKPAATPATPKPAGKPAAPGSAKPAAPKAKPAGSPASKPASE